MAAAELSLEPVEIVAGSHPARSDLESVAGETAQVESDGGSKPVTAARPQMSVPSAPVPPKTKGAPPPPPPPLPPASYKPALKSMLHSDSIDGDRSLNTGGKCSGLVTRPTVAVPQGLQLEIEKAILKPLRKVQQNQNKADAGGHAAAAEETNLRR